MGMMQELKILLLSWTNTTLCLRYGGAVSIDMTPISLCLPFNGSEAMNSQVLMNKEMRRQVASIRKRHQPTKISAVCISRHGVIAGGRIHYEPTWNLKKELFHD